MRAVRLTCAALLALGLAGCKHHEAQDRLAAARASGTLRIGITGTSQPWSTFDAHHQPTGYDVAVAQDVAHALGIAHPVFVPDSFKNFVEGLRTNKYDVVFNDLTPTPQRAEQVDFGQPYGVEDIRIFVTGGPERAGVIRGVADLAHRTVGVTTGSSNESWARGHLHDSDIKSYENSALAFRDLALGRIDAAIMSHFAGVTFMRESGISVQEIGPPLSFQLSAPAMAKGQPGFRAAIDGAVQTLLASGEIDTLARRFIGVHYLMSDAIRQGEQEADAHRPVPVARTLGGGLAKVIRECRPLLLPALGTTLLLGVSAFLLGSVLGILIALARLSAIRALRWLGFAYVSVFRGTPLLVQLLLVYFGLPQLGIQLGAVPAAILALTVFVAAYLSENFRAGILAIDKGQREAALSMGMGYWLMMRRVILPQGLRTALPSTGSRLVSLMKDTSLASVITVAELTRVADEVGAATFRYVEAFIVVGLIYWLLNQVLTIGQLAVEHRLSRHLR